MNKVQVRGWRVMALRPGTTTTDDLFITYPEGHLGHSLVTCLSCGAILAANVAVEDQLGPPLGEKLAEMRCPGCSKPLDGSWAAYPESYVVGGAVHSFERPPSIPPDEESVVEEFYGIYD